MLLFLNNAIFRGAGDAVIAMRCLWFANGLNLVLDPCLIFGWGPFPELGLEGAAIATATGRGSGVLLQFWILFRGFGRIRLSRAHLAFLPELALRLLRVSLGGIGQFLIATASWVVLARVVAPFGSHVLAGYTIAIRILLFALIPCWGLSNAVATLVGQNLGAGEPGRAERAVWTTGVMNMVFLLFVTMICVAIPERLAGLITSDPRILPTAIDASRIDSYGYVFYAWGMVMAQAFNGAGDTLTPTKLNFVCFWMIQIPLAWTLTHVLDSGPRGVFWSIALAESALAVSAMLVFRRGKWKSAVV
jgi:putative MATE family efflux protein